MLGTMDGPTYRAFKSAGVPDGEAEAAAHAVVSREDRMARAERESRRLKCFILNLLIWCYSIY